MIEELKSMGPEKFVYSALIEGLGEREWRNTPLGGHIFNFSSYAHEVL